MARKDERPDFLAARLSQDQYERLLRRKAAAHVRRDRRRGNPSASHAAYAAAIHDAAIRSGGRDTYTGEALDWSLISAYENAASKADGRRYKAAFALLPTADHVGDGLGPAAFEICAWRTNAAKADLPYDDFVALCERVVRWRRAAPAPKAWR